MKIEIRQATKDDIDGIVELKGQLADYHIEIDTYYKPGLEMRKEYKAQLIPLFERENVKIFVAEAENKVISYFIGTIEPSKPFIVPNEIGRIADAFVAEKYRGSGIGKQIFKKIIDWFRQNQINYVELSVDSRNKTGLNAWQKLGFKEYMKKMRLDL
ncbi:MAG: GNAT family N-acetyltransferase [Candidatus Hodarchaeota archaeon]